MSARRRVKVYFDGGCRPNPGRMEGAVVIRGEAILFPDMGTGNNTDAEWLALIRALETAQARGLQEFELIGDALEIIREANRALKGKHPLTGHAAAFCKAGPARPASPDPLDPACTEPGRNRPRAAPSTIGGTHARPPQETFFRWPLMVL
ncbi:ribonuclease HI [Novosphingobium colocasiae]